MLRLNCRLVLLSRIEDMWHTESLTDIQRAARYFYLQKSAYGGLVKRQSYAIHVVQRPNFSTARIATCYPSSPMTVCKGFRSSRSHTKRFSSATTGPTTLFYLDPPYWGRTLYRYNFNSHDFEMLEERLRSLRGKFVLSLNDVPRGSEAVSPLPHGGHTSSPIPPRRHPGNRYREVLITNFRR